MWLKEKSYIENMLTLHIPCKVAPTWKSNGVNGENRTIFVPKTQFIKPSEFLKPQPINQSSLCSSLRPSPPAQGDDSYTKHTTLLVQTYHEHQTLKALLEKLDEKGLCPLQVLKEDGDWTKHQFWAVIRFLTHSSRCHEILLVFDMWKTIEKSRINEVNYEKLIGLLAEEGMLEEGVWALQQMKNHSLNPSLEIYNSIIHGYARNGKFDDAMLLFSQMKQINLSPDTSTYDGLIEAYGKYKMYDEIGMCLKNMKSDGCAPDHITYNLLIREFSRGGLLQRMEKVYQTMISKRMKLQPSTLVAMLETYANFGILEKMEKIYRRVLNLKTALKEDLIRKLAKVYIENYMFSRLDDLGLDLSSRIGITDLVWCLRLLSHACVLSRKGMDSIVQKMEESKVSWNVTIVNIILLAYSKMKNFTHMRILLSELPTHQVEPDIVTIGILFDASRTGFDGTGALETWRRMGFLCRSVEMNTDPLVLTAFGKGNFLRGCEEVYCSLDPRARELKTWTYHSLIDLVVKNNRRQPL